jgi:flavin reductase (DIM6/NTAB) family NADH-FMN oxidoreductase RutF
MGQQKLMTVSPEELRSVLRQWASGVTVVTAGIDGELHGMTVSSFSSVSLEPALISVNIERRTRTHSLMEESGAFAVSILASDQQNLAQHFGGGVPDTEERLEGVPYQLGPRGSPLLEGGLASLECRIHAVLPAGTHSVFVGEVVTWDIQGGKLPLVYWQRDYRDLSGDSE